MCAPNDICLQANKKEPTAPSSRRLITSPRDNYFRKKWKKTWREIIITIRKISTKKGKKRKKVTERKETRREGGEGRTGKRKRKKKKEMFNQTNYRRVGAEGGEREGVRGLTLLFNRFFNPLFRRKVNSSTRHRVEILINSWILRRCLAIFVPRIPPHRPRRPLKSPGSFEVLSSCSMSFW